MASSATTAQSGGSNRRSGKKRAGRGPAWGKLAAIAVACVVLAALWRYTPLSEFVTGERVTGWARAIRGWHWAPLVVILIYTPAAFLMFPRPLLTLMTVIAFGPWLGFAYGMAGILLAALATYCAGRVMKKETVRRLAGDRLERGSRKLKAHGVIAMTAMRIVPVAPFTLEGIIAGAMRVKLWHYMLGTLLGMTPGVLATSVFGREITAALEDASAINWWIVGAVVLVFAAMIWFVKRWLARQ